MCYKTNRERVLFAGKEPAVLTATWPPYGMLVGIYCIAGIFARVQFFAAIFQVRKFNPHNVFFSSCVAINRTISFSLSSLKHTLLLKRLCSCDNRHILCTERAEFSQGWGGDDLPQN